MLFKTVAVISVILFFIALCCVCVAGIILR